MDAPVITDDATSDVWAMPLVTRIEKASPPSRRDALEAAARAVMMVWNDPRAEEEWAPAFQAWLSGAFRKVTRRARASRWADVQSVPGVTVTVGSASVRAFPPCLVSQTPESVRRLQVSGTDLAPIEPLSAPRDVPTLWLNPQLEMSAGKASAQVGHAAMMLALTMEPTELAQWRDLGFDLQVLEASPQQWRDLERGAVVVRDAGFTEVEPGSRTVAATRRP